MRFQFFDEIVDNDGEVWLVPDKGDRVKLSDCDIFGATDPSMGKQDRNRDPSAIVTIAAYPSQRIESSDSYRLYFVIDAEIGRRHPHEILESIRRLHRLRGYERHGIEAIQFEELFAEDVQKAVPDLHITKLKPRSDKALRIQKLSPFVYSGRMRFSRKLTELYDQLRYFPQAAHDDGPDALSLAMDTITSGAQMLGIDAETTSPQQVHPYVEQLRNALPALFSDASTETCGTCLHFERREGGPGRCTLRGGDVAADELQCKFHALSPDFYE